MVLLGSIAEIHVHAIPRRNHLSVTGLEFAETPDICRVASPVQPHFSGAIAEHGSCPHRILAGGGEAKRHREHGAGADQLLTPL